MTSQETKAAATAAFVEIVKQVGKIYLAAIQDESVTRAQVFVLHEGVKAGIEPIIECLKIAELIDVEVAHEAVGEIMRQVEEEFGGK